MDRILLAQALSVEDLSSADLSDSPPPQGTERGSMDIVRIVSPAVAMTAPAISSRVVLDTVQLPSGWLASFSARRSVNRRSWERFVGVRLARGQALPMDPVLRAGSLVVLDRHYNSLAAWKPPHPNLYGVRAGSQMLFRHVSFESSRLVLRPRALEYPVELIELAPQESPSDLVVGRVCLCISEA
jgi:hypothetical protein